ncbi:MAG: hypothetical protein IPG56_12185 [Caulobacteraceae bacterium]|nr:hypothetical protein [Caulobacteraceae bacterium]
MKSKATRLWTGGSLGMSGRGTIFNIAPERAVDETTGNLAFRFVREQLPSPDAQALRRGLRPAGCE